VIRRWSVLLILANYLLAVTVGEGFHDHGHHACVVDHRCAGGHGGSQAFESKNPPSQGSHNPCQVCRFLAQKPIPARTIETVDCAPLAEQVVAARSIRRAVPALSLRQIRAPPRVA
jgi:hypothetical protein